MKYEIGFAFDGADIRKIPRVFDSLETLWKVVADVEDLRTWNDKFTVVVYKVSE